MNVNSQFNIHKLTLIPENANNNWFIKVMKGITLNFFFFNKVQIMFWSFWVWLGYLL
jgi:hypothetical protein